MRISRKKNSHRVVFLISSKNVKGNKFCHKCPKCNAIELYLFMSNCGRKYKSSTYFSHFSPQDAFGFFLFAKIKQ